MITFWFRINASFLGYPAHPITIPKSQVPYGEVADLLLVSRDVWINIDGSPPTRGHVYHGIAGWGEYYQIRCDAPLLLFAKQFGHGELVQVSLLVAEGRLEIHVRRVWQPPDSTAA
jgi:hypothetical protein